jgi:predicted HTH domain antitoxin
MQVTFEVPDEIDLDELEARQVLIAALYGQGRLSEKEACDVLNTSRREFQDLLEEYGVPYMTADDASARAEVRAAERWRS